MVLGDFLLRESGSWSGSRRLKLNGSNTVPWQFIYQEEEEEELNEGLLDDDDDEEEEEEEERSWKRRNADEV